MRAYRALLDHDHAAVDAARRLAALAEKAGDEATLQLAWDRVVALDPFDAAAHSRIGAAGDEAPRLGGGDARIQGGAADQRRRQGDGALRPGGSLPARRPAARTRRRRRCPPWKSRRPSNGRRTCFCARSRESDVRAPLTPGAAAVRPRAAGRGCADAGWAPSRPPAPIARFAGLQWTFARVRYDAWTQPPGPALRHLRRALDD